MCTPHIRELALCTASSRLLPVTCADLQPSSADNTAAALMFPAPDPAETLAGCPLHVALRAADRRPSSVWSPEANRPLDANAQHSARGRVPDRTTDPRRGVLHKRAAAPHPALDPVSPAHRLLALLLFRRGHCQGPRGRGCAAQPRGRQGAPRTPQHRLANHSRARHRK